MSGTFTYAFIYWADNVNVDVLPWGGWGGDAPAATLLQAFSFQILTSFVMRVNARAVVESSGATALFLGHRGKKWCQAWSAFTQLWLQKNMIPFWLYDPHQLHNAVLKILSLRASICISIPPTTLYLSFLLYSHALVLLPRLQIES